MILEALAGWILFNSGACLGGPTQNTYVNKDTGQYFCGDQPPTQADLDNMQVEQTKEDEETIRFCIRQPDEGGFGPNGTVCTGTFSPYYLRSGKSQWEPVIQKILRDNEKYGVH